ncbi:MAG: sigma-54 dependent transcriptional regulator [Bryobacteraceae bacterium]|nr:sigma-54 dependent transcriptional regulator [Bryobacteraceae bacterium]
MNCSQPVLVGQSTRTRQVVKLVEKLGRGRWPVLVLGETGTGKEVVARSIYRVVGEGPFVTIDCSAMVGPLMESELFGHVRGSFTGATSAKTGLIEMANGGTAFFDEIGELPLDLQSKLLRVLQEKEFRPVGSTVTKRSDFRVVAATNRDLSREVERGTFRRDLFYRLNVVSVRIAPLRDRRDDIPTLALHFLERHGFQRTLTPEVLHALLEYDWPGNVRELENCILHMCAVNSGPLLHSRDLPSAIQNFRLRNCGETMAVAAGASTLPALPALPAMPPMAAALPARKPAGVEGAPLAEPPVLPLNEVERRAIINAIRYTNGDRLMAATLLGIGRTTLYRKLKEYELTA